MSDGASFGDIRERGLARLRELGCEDDLDLGTETRSSNRLNRRYLDTLTFEMRLLAAAEATTRSELFGVELAAPIIGAPLGFGRVLGRLAAHGPQYGTGYLEPIAEGLGAAGSLMGVGVAPAEQLQSVLDVGTPTYVIVKPYRERQRIVDKIADAERRGAVAVGIDIDSMFGVRTRYEPVGETYNAPLRAQELEELRATTRLPFIVKGILSVRDAAAAAAAGASALVVCHHGGEIIDYAVPPLKVLPAIATELEGADVRLLAGSGLHTGSDILKALALGADAVMLGTPLMLGLAADGAHGVEGLMRALQQELARNLSILGASTPADLEPDVLHVVP